MAKYPSAVKLLADLLHKLPGKFTVKNLEKALDKFVEQWATMNESAQVQEEMKCYDDQRMAEILQRYHP